MDAEALENLTVVGESWDLDISWLGEDEALEWRLRRREERIVLALPSPKRVCNLRAVQSCFIGHTKSFNTLYFGSQYPAENLLLIRGSYRHGNRYEDHYYFWVHPSTLIGEIGNSWLSFRHGKKYDASNSIPKVACAWRFGGDTMKWTDTVAQAGLKIGNSFWIRDARSIEDDAVGDDTLNGDAVDNDAAEDDAVKGNAIDNDAVDNNTVLSKAMRSITMLDKDAVKSDVYQ
jgi:hypothetical protein